MGVYIKGVTTSFRWKAFSENLWKLDEIHEIEQAEKMDKNWQMAEEDEYNIRICRSAIDARA